MLDADHSVRIRPARTGDAPALGPLLADVGFPELIERGCTIVEVISNRRFSDAHVFYEQLGYELTSYKFKKILSSEI
jgi:hypothetical protein